MSTTMTVGEFKARLPAALGLVGKGESVVVTYGRSRRPVAVLMPPPVRSSRRKLGRLAGKVRVVIGPEWELTEGAFLAG